MEFDKEDNMTFKTKFLLIILLIGLISKPIYADSLESIELTGESAILINSNTGQILFSKNSELPLYPASTTKILTAIIAIEDLNLEDIVTIDSESPYAGGSHIALEVGEQLTVKDLIYGLMIASANDSAEALARFHSGTIESFAKVMNERAASMGAVNSNFENPHGLHHDDHVTTAYDLAQISAYAMKNETFRNIVKTLRYEIPPTNKKDETRYLNSTNSMFFGIPGSNTSIAVDGKQVPTSYDFATGIKRGYTDMARSCFVGSATFDESRTYISVVLKTEGHLMYEDTRKMFDYAENYTKTVVLAEPGSKVDQIVINTQKETLITGLAASRISIDLPLDLDENLIEQKIIWQPNLQLPIQENEIIGIVEYYLNAQLLLKTNLVSDAFYSGENLINEATTHLPHKSPTWVQYGIKLLIALLLWRFIMTFINLKKIKYKKKNAI